MPPRNPRRVPAVGKTLGTNLSYQIPIGELAACRNCGARLLTAMGQAPELAAFGLAGAASYPSGAATGRPRAQCGVAAGQISRLRAAVVEAKDGPGRAAGSWKKPKKVLEDGLTKDAQARKSKKELAFGKASAMEIFVVIFADYQSDLIVLDLIDRVTSVRSVLQIAEGAVLAYVVGDILSGLLLWALYNYASPTVPVIGEELTKARDRYQAYLARHGVEKPDTGAGPVSNDVALSSFFTLCKGPCQLTLPVLTVVAGWGSSSTLVWESFFVFLFSIIAVLPQLHAWSLSLQVPAAVSGLQATGLLARRRWDPLATSGGGTIPRDGYCFVSGLGNWMGKLAGGEQQLRKFERMIWRASAGRVAPRVWQEYPGVQARIEQVEISQRRRRRRK